MTGNFETLTSFLECFLEASANGHDFTNRLHLEAEAGVSPMEFIEVETRNFYDYVIQGRLKECAGCLGNRVFEFIQVKTDGQFGCDFRNWVSCCFGGQGGTSTYPWVDFDGDNLFVYRINAKLYVATSGENTHTAHHLESHIAHSLEGGIAQRHCRGYGN